MVYAWIGVGMLYPILLVTMSCKIGCRPAVANCDMVSRVRNRVKEMCTHGTGWLEPVWSFDCHLELEVLHVLALTNAKVATEELLLELRDLGADVAKLVVPLVDR